VCPIRNLWIIISSRRGKRKKLITFTFGSIACSLLSVLEFHRVLRVNFIPKICSQTSSYDYVTKLIGRLNHKFGSDQTVTSNLSLSQQQQLNGYKYMATEHASRARCPLPDTDDPIHHSNSYALMWEASKATNDAIEITKWWIRSRKYLILFKSV